VALSGFSKLLPLFHKKKKLSEKRFIDSEVFI
jgi:hypothetical protein